MGTHLLHLDPSSESFHHLQEQHHHPGPRERTQESVGSHTPQQQRLTQPKEAEVLVGFLQRSAPPNSCREVGNQWGEEETSASTGLSRCPTNSQQGVLVLIEENHLSP